MGLTIGEIVPLNVQLPDDNADVFVRATVLDPLNNPIGGSPFTLSYLEQGNYGTDMLLMPDEPWIKAIYEIFDDAGFTMPSNVYGTSSDVFYQDTSGTVTVNNAQTITGVVIQGQSLIGTIVDPE